MTGAEPKPVHTGSRASEGDEKPSASKRDKETSESVPKKPTTDRSETKTALAIPATPSEPIAMQPLPVPAPDPTQTGGSESGQQSTRDVSILSIGREEAASRGAELSSTSSDRFREFASYQQLALDSTPPRLKIDDKSGNPSPSIDVKSLDDSQKSEDLPNVGSSTADKGKPERTAVTSASDSELLNELAAVASSRVPSPRQVNPGKAQPVARGSENVAHDGGKSAPISPVSVPSNAQQTDQAKPGTVLQPSLALSVENAGSSLPLNGDTKRVGSIDKSTESKAPRHSAATTIDARGLKAEHDGSGDASAQASSSGADLSSNSDRHEEPDSQSQQSAQPISQASPAPPISPHIHTPQNTTDLSGPEAKSASAPVDAAPIKHEFQAEQIPWNPGINTAHVMHAMSQSEMRVGMNTAEFGEIAVHTAISQQQILTRISVDHRELSGTIASHATALATKLGSDYGVQASIEVKQTGSSFSSDRQQSQQQEHRPQNSAKVVLNHHNEQEINRVQVDRVSLLHESYRLDIRV